MRINREYTTRTYTIASGAALTDEIDARYMAGAIVIIPAAWTAANLGIKVSPTSGGTFVILNDYLGAPVQVSGITTDASKAYALPDEIYATGFVKLWSKSATAATITDVNQAAARSIIVVLKG